MPDIKQSRAYTVVELIKGTTMAQTLQLDDMTTQEKLIALEAIWANLSQTAGSLTAPDWHQAVLAQREAAINKGKASFSDWPSAKQRLRNQRR